MTGTACLSSRHRCERRRFSGLGRVEGTSLQAEAAGGQAFLDEAHRDGRYARRGDPCSQ